MDSPVELAPTSGEVLAIWVAFFVLFGRGQAGQMGTTSQMSRVAYRKLSRYYAKSGFLQHSDQLLLFF